MTDCLGGALSGQFFSLGDTSAESFNGFVETPSIITLALSQLRDVVAEMPENEKTDYLTAALVAPGLVQSESAPLNFIRHANYNVFAAARRLVLYWEYRRKIFSEQWLHPLSTGAAEGGMLSDEDKYVLASGWVAVAKKPDSPAVITIDNSRLQGQFQDSRIRVIFYLCTVSNDFEAQTQGIKVIQTMSQPSLPFPLMKILLEMLQRSIPIRVSKVVCVKSEAHHRGSIASFYSKKLATTLSEMFGPGVPHVVTVSDARLASAHLEGMAITRDCIPMELGGTWSYQQLFEWQNHVIISQKSAPVSTLTLISTSDAGTDNPEREEELSRARNALYSRRSYQKKKAKENVLEDEKKGLEEVNARLRQENVRLERLMAHANAVLEAFQQQKLVPAHKT